MVPAARGAPALGAAAATTEAGVNAASATAPDTVRVLTTLFMGISIRSDEPTLKVRTDS
jgi:hypothetical protein